MRHHKLFYGSSYDRGLQHLLEMWNEIRTSIKDAELHICYGWETFDQLFRDNPERQMYKEKMNDLMKHEGITHHGRVGKEKLAMIRRQCGIWAYPCHFQEINCITALESQADGLVPVTMNNFALKETVGAGIKVDGEIEDVETQQLFLSCLIELIKDKEKWGEESRKAREFAKDYSWDKISSLWSFFF